MKFPQFQSYLPSSLFTIPSLETSPKKILLVFCPVVPPLRPAESASRTRAKLPRADEPPLSPTLPTPRAPASRGNRSAICSSPHGARRRPQPDRTETRSPSTRGHVPGPRPRARGDSRGPAYSLRKSLSWRLSVSRSSAELCRPQPSGARGARPRGGEDMLRGLRRAGRRAVGSLGWPRGGRRVRGRRRLGGAGGGRHFPGRAGFFESNRALLKRRKQTRTQVRGRPAGRGGAEVTYGARAEVWRPLGVRAVIPKAVDRSVGKSCPAAVSGMELRNRYKAM